MAEVIVDLSANNTHPIDYRAAKGAGVVGAIVKATQGLAYTNPYFATDVDGFAAVGVPVIAYHFAGFTDAVSEADFFKRVAGGRARVLDSETNSDVQWQNEFLAILGLQPDQMMDYGSESSLPRQGIHALLWVADYGQKPDFGVCWQYTETGSIAGIAGKVDLSEWTGTQAQFDSVFGTVTPPKPKPPPPHPKDYEIMDSCVAPNGDIVSHAVTTGGHYLEITRKVGTQGEPAKTFSIIDVTDMYGGEPLVAP